MPLCRPLPEVACEADDRTSPFATAQEVDFEGLDAERFRQPVGYAIGRFQLCGKGIQVIGNRDTVQGQFLKQGHQACSNLPGITAGKNRPSAPLRRKRPRHRRQPSLPQNPASSTSLETTVCPARS